MWKQGHDLLLELLVLLIASDRIYLEEDMEARSGGDSPYDLSRSIIDIELVHHMVSGEMGGDGDTGKGIQDAVRRDPPGTVVGPIIVYIKGKACAPDEAAIASLEVSVLRTDVVTADSPSEGLLISDLDPMRIDRVVFLAEDIGLVELKHRRPPHPGC